MFLHVFFIYLEIASNGAVTRDGDFFDMFSGIAMPSRLLRDAGKTVFQFDSRRHESEDITTLPGMLWCGVLCARLKENAGCMMGPSCAPWVFMSSGTTLRNKTRNIFGADHLAFVQDSNITALFLSWLVVFLTMRSVHWVIEQPVSSLLWHFPSVSWALRTVRANRISTWLGSFGHHRPKPTALNSNLPIKKLGKLKRAKPAKSNECHNAWHRRGRWISGGKGLKATSEYPAEFAQALTQAILS